MQSAALRTSIAVAVLASLLAVAQIVAMDGSWLALLAAVTTCICGGMWVRTVRLAQQRSEVELVRRTRGEQAARELLQLVARGAPQHECLTRMTLSLEQLFEGSCCAVLLVSSDGTQHSLVAGPHVPAELKKALSGLPLDDDATPCGAAARDARPVIVRDLLRDERWAKCRELARSLHVRACWAVPIVSSQGKVLGVFELYHRFPSEPSESQLEYLQRIASLASLAIERGLAHEALARSEGLLQKVFQNAPVGIYMRDGQGKLVYENPALERLFDPYSREVKEGWQNFVHPDDRRETARIMEALITGGSDNTEQTVRMVFAANDTRIIHVLSSAVRTDGKLSAIVGTIQDVTRQKQLETQLAQAQKMELVGQLAGGIAHDFNNLLTIILNALHLVQQSVPEAQQTLVGHAVSASERAAELTMQLLTFSRKQPLALRPLELTELVKNQCTMLTRLMGETVTLRTESDGSEALVDADPNMFGQLLMNLVVNARDAMPKGGDIAIRVETVITSSPGAKAGSSKTFVRVSVSDSGVGIAPEHLEHIFEPFYTTKEPGKGTGLGLAMVYSIAEQHKGFVEVETTLGRGTTFHVYLPRTAGGAPGGLITRPDKPVTGSEGVLLVEDEPGVREMVAAALSHCGYRVFEAESGDRALDVWSQHEAAIELLITDIVMPGQLSGPALVQRLREDRPQLRVVYMSGYGAQDEENEPLTALVRKPFQLLTLASVVRTLLDQPSPPRSASSDRSA